MATLAKLLQVDMGLPDMAKRLAAAGRGKDSILAHINPKEMALLKKHGGSGKINPETGIMEFQNEGGADDSYDIPESSPANVPNRISNIDLTSQTAPAEAAPAGLQTDMSVARPPISPAASGGGQSTITADDGNLGGGGTGTPTQEPTTTGTVTPGVVGGNIGGQVPAAQSSAQPNFIDRASSAIKPYTDSAKKLSEALQPLAPYAKVGTSALALYQGQQAANKQNAAAAANEAEVRKLADPYRAQAEKIAQQGQQMLQMGQQGGLTAAQQQKLETQRAAAMQQQAQAGITGGTAAQETEAMIQRQASQFAQDNVTQGLQLISQAQSISGTADALIKQAISTGYTQSVDASKLAAEFYNALGFSLPETASKGPTTAQPQASTEAPVDLSQG
jgi:hypothetical protein